MSWGLRGVGKQGKPTSPRNGEWSWANENQKAPFSHPLFGEGVGVQSFPSILSKTVASSSPVIRQLEPLSSNCVGNIAIDLFTVFSTFDIDKLKKIRQTTEILLILKD